MERTEPQGLLERDVLRHLLDGGQIRELAPKLGLSFEQLACRVDLKALRLQVRGLRWLAEQCEGFTASRERARAAEHLGRLLDQRLGAETTRRICAQLLREPPARRGASPQRESAACEFLRQVLTDGPRPSTQVMELARRSGIAPRTLQRAKASVHVVTQRQGFGRNGRFIWRLLDTEHPRSAAVKGGGP